MWIREALADPPPGAWAGIGLGWLRSVLLAIAAVLAGKVVDAALALAGAGSAGIPGAASAATPDILVPAALAALAAVAAALAGGRAEALPSRIRAAEEASWRRRVMGAVLRDDARRGASARPEGTIIDAATSGVESTATYRGEFLGPTLASFTAPLFVLVVWAVAVDAASAAALAAFIAVVPVVIVVAGKRLRRSNGVYRRRQAAATNRYLEMIEGLGTLRVLGAAGRARDAFARSARAAMAELTRLLARNQLMIIVNDAIFGVVMGAVATGLILWRLAGGAITPGAAMAALLMTVLLHEPIDRIGRTFYIGLGGRAHRDGLDELIGDHAAAGHDGVQVGVAKQDDGGGEVGVVKQDADIELRDVSVTLGGAPILRDVSVRIPGGAHTAIVGPSGAGKTTLVRVISGAIDADGEVLVGGVPVARERRRGLVTVVGQNPGILGTTVAGNLRLAAPEATDGQLRDALGRAHVLDEIDARPGGLDSRVGAGGAHLSGGQRRRIAIARAFLRARPVLLLDEPTADLDRGTEARVRAALADAKAGRTTITVAHRLDTTLDADLVIVLDGGRIAAAGTPEEVRAAGGYYARGLDTERLGGAGRDAADPGRRHSAGADHDAADDDEERTDR